MNEEGLLGVGVEVGVRQGNFSRKILCTWQGKLLVLVDAWRTMPEMRDMTGTMGQSGFDRWYNTAVKNLEPFEDRTKIERMLSAEAAAAYPDNHFDFVYIDCNHAYDEAGRFGIVQDLRLWWPKLRAGGLFAGHDYYNEGDLSVYGVRKAVDEFAARVDAEVLSTTHDTSPSWYWIK